MSIFEVMFDVRSIQVTEKTEQREKKLYAMALQKPYYTVNANQQFEKLCIFLTYVSIWVFAEVFVFTISIRHVAAHTNQNNWNEKYQIFVAKKNSGKKTLRRVFSFEVFFFRRLFFCYGDGALFTLTCTQTPSRPHMYVIIQANTRPNRLINHIGYEARTNSSWNIFSELFIHFSLESEFLLCRRRN